MQAFVREWVMELAKPKPNARLAAVRAGYAPVAAAVQATRLLKDPRVQALVAQRQKRIAARLERRQQRREERILRELELVGLARLSRALQEGENGPELLPLDQLPPAERAALSEISITENVVQKGDAEVVLSRRTKVKMGHKVQALMGMARLLGLEKEPTPARGAVAGVQIIVNGGPTGLEVTAITAAGAAPRLPPATVEIGGGD
jgi:hypothetical protein